MRMEVKTLVQANQKSSSLSSNQKHKKGQRPSETVTLVSQLHVMPSFIALVVMITTM